MTSSPSSRPVAWITGSTRGIGKAIALKLAQEGYAIVVCGKTQEPHPKLPGTIAQTVAEVEALGVPALGCVLDVRFEDQIASVVAQIQERFGRLDCLVNNASAIDLGSIETLSEKKYDLIMQVNAKGTYFCSKHAFALLKNSPQAHVLTLSPPLDHDLKWYQPHLAYTLSKYNMTTISLSLAAQWKKYSIAVNTLWPKTIIATAAIEMNFPSEFMKKARKPQIVADAAYEIIRSRSDLLSGQSFLDEDVLELLGEKDFSHYSVDSNEEPILDLYVSSTKR